MGILLAVAALAAAATAPAHAKGIAQAELCGSDRCVTIDGADYRYVEGTPAAPPEKAVPYMELRIEIGGEVTKGEPRPTDSFTNRYVPSLGLLRGESGTWTQLDPEAVATLRRAAGRLEAIGLTTAAAAPPATPPERPAPTDSGFPVSVPVLAAALAALLAAVALATTRRRRAAPQT